MGGGPSRLYCRLVTAFLPNFLRLLFLALYVLILGRVLMSWVNPRFDSPVGRFLYETTEPILQPIRRVLPQTGMIDFSPIVAFVVLSVLASALGVG
jgi:YggT family protein